MSEENLLTMEEAIERLSTTRGTFYRWLRAGRINGFKAGRQWRFSEAEIDRFLKGDQPTIDLPVNSDDLVKTITEYINDTSLEVPGPDGSVEQIVNIMLICGLRKGASNIFLDVGHESASYSLRIDGIFHTITNYDSRLHKPVIDRLKQMCELDVMERRLPQDGRIHMKIAKDRSIDFVVSMLPTLFGESCTLSIRDPAAAHMGFEPLGLRGDNLANVQSVIDRKHGLHIVGGPSGSGKSVTAYSLLHANMSSDQRALSIEHPGTELLLPDVIQTVTRGAAGLGVNELIRATTRQNFDVLHVGEIGEPETLMLLMHASLSGKVIAAMHLKDAAQGLLTIRDWGGKDQLMSDAVALITAQRLARRLCTRCREACEPDEDEKALIDDVCNEHGLPPIDGTFYKPVGCEHCHDGFIGRIGLFETLLPFPALERALVGDADHDTLRRLAIESGMESLLLDGIRKASEGIISLQEIRRVAGDLLVRPE
jgi:type IV pilus assembly protein PilB